MNITQEPLSVLSLKKNKEMYVLTNTTSFIGEYIITSKNCNGDNEVIDSGIITAYSKIIFTPLVDNIYTLTTSGEIDKHSFTIYHFANNIKNTINNLLNILCHTDNNCNTVIHTKTTDNNLGIVFNDLFHNFILSSGFTKYNTVYNPIKLFIDKAIHNSFCDYTYDYCKRLVDLRINGNIEYSDYYKKVLGIIYLGLYYYEQDLAYDNDTKLYINSKYKWNDIKPCIVSLGLDESALVTIWNNIIDPIPDECGTQFPVFELPFVTLTNNHTDGIYEVGEVVSLELTATFNKGSIIGALVDDGSQDPPIKIWDENAFQDFRSGNPNKYIIDGTVYDTHLLQRSKILNPYKIKKGQNIFEVVVVYNQGIQPLDSNNNPYDTPLPQGTVGNTTSFNGVLRLFAGSSSSIPSDGYEVRSLLLNESFLNEDNIYINTGNTNNVFIIAIPSNKTVNTIINTNTNEDLVSMFLLTSITTIPDASGDLHSYNVYIMGTAIPFSTNNLINITLV